MERMLVRYFYNVRQKCSEIIDIEYTEKKNKYAIVRDLVGLSLKRGFFVKKLKTV